MKTKTMKTVGGKAVNVIVIIVMVTWIVTSLTAPANDNKILRDALESRMALNCIAMRSEPNEPPVWGNGDLPAKYTANFGNDNGARLNYVQNQMIDKHNKIIAEIARRVIAIESDPNDLDARITALESIQVYDDIGPDGTMYFRDCVGTTAKLEGKSAVQDGIDQAYINAIEGGDPNE